MSKRPAPCPDGIQSGANGARDRAVVSYGNTRHRTVLINGQLPSGRPQLLRTFDLTHPSNSGERPAPLIFDCGHHLGQSAVEQNVDGSPVH